MGVSGKTGLVVIAHPDDEVLWCGGCILMHPDWRWRIVTLCRGSDPDRAPRFRSVLPRLNASGAMGDLDDGPEQTPVTDAEIDDVVHALTADLPRPDLLITHGPHGEYTRHLRHEECHRAIVRACASQTLAPRTLWCFAYDDCGGRSCPAPDPDAPLRYRLSPRTYAAKRALISGVYGFSASSWEYRCAPRTEAFREWEAAS